jgi:kynurenine 3-monooxygenase
MHQDKQQKITILGAGLAGSLLASLLAQQGYAVEVYEKRPDPRAAKTAEGRSINLALSHRGWRALESAGIDPQVREKAIPMKGRMVHSLDGESNLQPYGKEGQAIYSVSRAELNQQLISQSEKQGVQFYFEHACQEVDLDHNHLILQAPRGQKSLEAGLLIGADGAFSALRSALQKTPRFNYSQHFIAHGYKELTIPPTAGGDYAMEPNALHIWPRGGFMLIALPNPDKSFTCTLFLSYEGEKSFARLSGEESVLQFFKENLPDAVPLMPELTTEFFQNPLSDLVTIRAYPWTYNGRQVLIGDAAHAIVPFYGQGMNAAFEDCRILSEMLEEGEEFTEVVHLFQQQRNPDADAIADLALRNFVEMRDLVADERFLERKKIEAELHRRFPDQWVPLYSMVTFSHRRYSEALSIGQQQDKIMEKVMEEYGSASALSEADYERIVNLLIDKESA